MSLQVVFVLIVENDSFVDPRSFRSETACAVSTDSRDFPIAKQKSTTATVS